jgi:hypothetical protein
MSALGQKQFQPTQQKAKTQKYVDSKLRATNAQRSSFSPSKTFFLLNVHDETADCRRVTCEGLGRKQIDGLKEQQRHNKRQAGTLPHRGEADQIRREE